MTNLLSLWHVSLAYKTLALQLMLSEANWAGHQLRLPGQWPITQTNLVASLIGPPRITGTNVGGALTASNYWFSFTNDGKLWNLIYHKYGPDTSIVVGEYAETEMRRVSVITTNDAYQMATNWLTQISVDVEGLNRKYKPRTWQQRRCDPPLTIEQLMALKRWEDAPLVDTPIFHVAWGSLAKETPAPKDYKPTTEYTGAEVVILGSTKELLEIRILESEFCKRPPLVITNAAELNSRPDPPMKAKALQVPKLTNGPTETRQ